jgi:hypothetical protein
MASRRRAARWKSSTLTASSSCDFSSVNVADSSHTALHSTARPAHCTLRLGMAAQKGRQRWPAGDNPCPRAGSLVCMMMAVPAGAAARWMRDHALQKCCAPTQHCGRHCPSGRHFLLPDRLNHCLLQLGYRWVACASCSMSVRQRATAAGSAANAGSKTILQKVFSDPEDAHWTKVIMGWGLLEWSARCGQGHNSNYRPAYEPVRVPDDVLRVHRAVHASGPACRTMFAHAHAVRVDDSFVAVQGHSWARSWHRLRCSRHHWRARLRPVRVCQCVCCRTLCSRPNQALRLPLWRRFVVGTMLSSVLAYHTLLQVDHEEFGGHVHLVMEDANVSLPVFLVSRSSLFLP